MELIEKQDAINALKAIRHGLWEIDIPHPGNCPEYVEHHRQIKDMMGITDGWIKRLEDMPSAQPTLYGYSVEHLARIAAVMAAEHISPREAISIIKNADALVNLVISEQQKIMKERFLELAQAWQEESALDRGASQ